MKHWTFNELTPLQERFIQRVTETHSLAAAMFDIGVSGSTLEAWRKNAAFEAALYAEGYRRTWVDNLSADDREKLREWLRMYVLAYEVRREEVMA